MPRRSRISALSQQARFVFKGTVKKMKAATMAEVPISPRTAIVSVDEVLTAPEALTHYAGQDITVELEGRGAVAAGQQAVFYTNAWLFGSSLAVLAVEQQPLESSPAVLAGTTVDPVATLATRDVEDRLSQAEVVVSGRVVSVALPAETGAMKATASPGQTTLDEPLSEHTPLWRHAVIELAAVHKGRHSGKRAVVRFPASTDVMWYRAPKFHAGQEGFFMLHKKELKASARRGFALSAKGPTASMYTALHPSDFQPFDEPGGIQQAVATLMTGPSSTVSKRRVTRRSSTGSKRK